MFKVRGTKSGRNCTDLDAYISKKQKVPANAKCYLKEIMPSRCLRHSIIDWLQPVITTFRVSVNPGRLASALGLENAVNLQNWLVYLNM